MLRTNIFLRGIHSSVRRLERALNLSNMNPYVKELQYAVRGPIVQRANEIEDEISAGKQRPYDTIVRCNIGDCHATGQKPITFIRQVVAAATLTELMGDGRFPKDVVEKAQRVLDSCGGNSLGAYSQSPGVRVIRQDVAQYIQERDGYPSDWNHVFLSTGASEAIKTMLQMLCCPGPNGELPGVMLPIPVYPLYSATLTEYNMYQINYFLDEDNHWGLQIPELKAAVDASRASGANPKAIVIINPGNPTGQVLTKENIQDIIKFAKQENIMILADEVYQHNIYDPQSKFHSFKKVLMEMGKDYTDVQLASFMSCSKGYMGECGYRGGYMELVNFDEEIVDMVTKLTSVKLCSTVSGQLVMDCVVNHPKPGEPSYDLWHQETSNVLKSLSAKAELVADTFENIDGINCNNIQGSMYCFPRLDLPEKLLAAAKAKGVTPDSMYCFELLEKVGLCVVPGAGFGQEENTHHFRCTILPQEDEFRAVMKKFKYFHEDFLKQWR